VVVLVALRLALVSRWTLWISASLGTLSVAGACGFVAWVFGHVIEVPGAASIIGVAAGIGGALLPAWAYGSLAGRRAQHVPDSLVGDRPSTEVSSH
jgi:hypothetical protein